MTSEMVPSIAQTCIATITVLCHFAREMPCGAMQHIELASCPSTSTTNPANEGQKQGPNVERTDRGHFFRSSAAFFSAIKSEICCLGPHKLQTQHLNLSYWICRLYFQTQKCAIRFFCELFSSRKNSYELNFWLRMSSDFQGIEWGVGLETHFKVLVCSNLGALTIDEWDTNQCFIGPDRLVSIIDQLRGFQEYLHNYGIFCKSKSVAQFQSVGRNIGPPMLCSSPPDYLLQILYVRVNGDERFLG